MVTENAFDNTVTLTSSMAHPHFSDWAVMEDSLPTEDTKTIQDEDSKDGIETKLDADVSVASEAVDSARTLVTTNVDADRIVYQPSRRRRMISIVLREEAIRLFGMLNTTAYSPDIIV